MDIWQIVGIIIAAFISGAVGQSFLSSRKLKKALYNQDGTTIFIPRSECTQMHNQCQTAVCRKIDDLKKDLKRMDEKREEARADWSELKGMILEFIRTHREIQQQN